MNARQIIDEAIDPKRVLRSLRRREQMSVGEEVISGTGITRDIMEATFDKLKELNPIVYEDLMTDEIREYLAGGEPADFDPEYYLYEQLFPHMGLYCPPFTYFGSYEADGSIGCWPIDEMELEELVDKGVLVIQHGETPDWSDRGIIGYHKNLILIKPSGSKECWDIHGTPFLVWQW